ncbi:anaerobic ribonucleoside-triphosphate reductase [Patescibacteria group bacterium]
MSNQSNPTILQNQKRQKCEVYSRVSGYLRPVNSWNKGKQAEFYDRKEYKINANDMTE